MSIVVPKSFKYSPEMSFSNKSEKFETNYLQPMNGSSFPLGTGKVQFEVENHQDDRINDVENCYMMCKINNASTDTDFYLQGRAGTASLVKNFRLETSSGQKFSELTSSNVLYPILLSKSVDDEYLNKKGKYLMGTGAPSVITTTMNTATPPAATTLVSYPGYGDVIPQGSFIEKIIPLAQFTGMKKMPMKGREVTRFIVELEESAVCGFNDPIANNLITLTDCQLVYNTYKLNPAFTNQLIPENAIITSEDWIGQTEVIPAASTKQNIKVGFSKKYLKKLIVCFRNGNDSVDSTKLSLCARNKANIKEILVRHNAQPIHSNAIRLSNTNNLQSYCELMNSHGGLYNLHTTSLSDLYNTQESAGDDDTTCGQFFYEVDLENGFEMDSVGFSGIDVGQNAVTIEITKDATTQDQVVNIFGLYANQYTYVNGVWIVSDPL